jgi:ribonucleoside-triphosphate reductase (thioredoxin)
MTKDNPFPSQYEEFIFKSRYAKWIESENRRENWGETVTRLLDYYSKQIGGMDGGDYYELHDAIYNLEVMPSMRAMMTAGPAMDRCHVPAYNCAYVPVDSPRTFDETIYILMCGTGVGYSVEEHYVQKLPIVSESFEESSSVVHVADSKEGWAKSLRELIALLYAGQLPKWDVSRVRPAGSRLRTFGGRASGPEPLVDLFGFTVRLFQGAAGRRLTSLECHDLMCKIADVVVVGGVRRSAMISLSDVNDDRLRNAKTGAWWMDHGYRGLANNSAVYSSKTIDTSTFMKEWKSLYDSKSGERGFFSRYACRNIARRNGRRNADFEFGTNPCSEIILRPFQFCNLTEVVVRPTDSIVSLQRKVRAAAILGTIQSTFTSFRYLRKVWQDNCNEERLLGVSLTGVLDNPSLILDPSLLEHLRNVVVETNKEWAERLSIPPSVATTCVKPSGTVSQLVDSASGLHARHSDFYLRTVRADNKDPLTQFLIASGVYHEPCVVKPQSTTVFYFAKRSPEHSTKRDGISAIGSLEVWDMLQRHWCEHKPSATIYVKENEWMEVGAWVYENLEHLSGVSFLPYDGGVYKQAPYQELSEDDWNKWVAEHPMPEINWDDLRFFEIEDTTTGSQTLACFAGQCEVVSIGDVDD